MKPTLARPAVRRAAASPVGVRRVAGITFVWCVGFAGVLGAQALPAPMNQLLGPWAGEGQLFGRPAEFSMRWQQDLRGQFVRLNFHNAMVTETGADTAVVAHGYYRVHSHDSITGTWLDSRGVTQPLWGRTDGASLIINWGTSETELGRTVYTLRPDDTVVVVDSVLRGAAWQEFARAAYQRTREPRHRHP